MSHLKFIKSSGLARMIGGFHVSTKRIHRFSKKGRFANWLSGKRRARSISQTNGLVSFLNRGSQQYKFEENL